MDEGDIKSHIKARIKVYLPFLVFFLLVIILLLSSVLSSHSPEIESVSPGIGETGDELLIKGRYFGSSRDGGIVSVAGISPPTSSYQWSDREIRFIVPREMAGGLVKVVAKHGESGEVICFTNTRQLPVIVSGPLNPGEPYISRIEPNSGTVGTVITLSGLNFGLKRGTVDFSWVSGDSSTNALSDSMITALEINHDYVAWADREVQVRVPDGATSGNVKILTDKGTSNAEYFEVDDRAGSKRYENKVTYIIQRTVDIKTIRAETGNGLYLWVPRIVDVPEQRNLQLLFLDPDPLNSNYRGFMLFFFEDLKEGERYKLSYSQMFDRYEVNTTIIEWKVAVNYNKLSRLYQEYTNSDAVVPSSDKKIVQVSKAVNRGVKNPYVKARRIYDYVKNRLSYDESPEAVDIVKALDAKKGNAYTYAVLFCALARSSGIPARPIAGYIVTDPDRRLVAKHFWAEFYLEKIGWVPVDPLLGDGRKFGDFPTGVSARSYYFGNMDNRHIALVKGLPKLKQMDPDGRTVRLDGQASFQPIHEEATGKLRGYSSIWGELEIPGIY